MKQALGLVYSRASAAAVSLSEQIVAHTSDGVVVALTTVGAYECACSSNLSSKEPDFASQYYTK